MTTKSDETDHYIQYGYLEYKVGMKPIEKLNTDGLVIILQESSDEVEYFSNK